MHITALPWTQLWACSWMSIAFWHPKMRPSQKRGRPSRPNAIRLHQVACSCVDASLKLRMPLPHAPKSASQSPHVRAHDQSPCCSGTFLAPQRRSSIGTVPCQRPPPPQSRRRCPASTGLFEAVAAVVGKVAAKSTQQNGTLTSNDTDALNHVAVGLQVAAGRAAASSPAARDALLGYISGAFSVSPKALYPQLVAAAAATTKSGVPAQSRAQRAQEMLDLAVQVLSVEASVRSLVSGERWR